jgi:hypothetical protein
LKKAVFTFSLSTFQFYSTDFSAAFQIKARILPMFLQRSRYVQPLAWRFVYGFEGFTILVKLDISV